MQLGNFSVSLAVKDIAASRAFYEKLGFTQIAGGLAYTAGIGFYAAERVRYGHFVWHVFVLMGTTCHFFAVLWYAA